MISRMIRISVPTGRMMITEITPVFKVYRLGGSLWTWIIFALIVLGVICFVLPTFLFIGIIGLVVGSIIIYLSKLFQ